MFYKFMRYLISTIFYIINGNFKVINKNKLPKGNYILVGPHRTWWEPLFFALAGYPTQFMFMAKTELFKNKLLKLILINANAFPVDRDNPDLNVIKFPVNKLKKSDLSLIMFPSGSRSSKELKGGVFMIAKLSQTPIVPITYNGPLKFSSLFKRNNVFISIGDPITIDKTVKLNKDNTDIYSKILQNSFDKLDIINKKS